MAEICYQNGPETLRQQRPALTTRRKDRRMADRADITPELCRQLLRYDPETGKLFWLWRPASMFVGGVHSPQRRAKSWNARCAGKQAFTAKGSHGYHEGTIFNIKVLAHRVIWALVHGEWPEHEVDHDNGNRTDNRLSNLMVKTHGQNLKNAAGKCTNTSGANGVSWRASRGKWRARITVDGKDIHLGQFDDFDAAVAARGAASAKYGFTARHGEKHSDSP